MSEGSCTNSRERTSLVMARRSGGLRSGSSRARTYSGLRSSSSSSSTLSLEGACELAGVLWLVVGVEWVRALTRDILRAPPRPRAGCLGPPPLSHLSESAPLPRPTESSETHCLFLDGRGECPRPPPLPREWWANWAIFTRRVVVPCRLSVCRGP